MNYWKLLYLIPVFVIVGFIFGVVRGSIIMQEQSSIVKNDCAPTDLYVIGDKGHRNRIYDCTDVEL